MNESIIMLGTTQSELSKLIWTNKGSGSFHFDPDEFIVAVDTTRLRSAYPSIDSVEISLPFAWISDRPTWRPIDTTSQTIIWNIKPRERPSGFDVSIRATCLARGRAIVQMELSLGVEVLGFSQFDPSTYAFPAPNSVAGWGVIEPKRDVFGRTYGVTLFRDRFFKGLYRSIVFLGATDGRYQGGICTGLARAALEWSLSANAEEPSLDQILLWHGRQLCDRALLASSWWLFFPSPRRAFQTFRREILRDGITSRCFDIGVPKPWRRDILDALQKEGHTVVPFAFRQTSRDRASVTVYDPNDPGGSQRGDCKMTFWLDRNTYEYPGIATADDCRTTVIATDQRSYRVRRSAVLASLASVILACGSQIRTYLKSRETRRMTQRPGASES